jgi:hypothetical protein
MKSVWATIILFILVLFSCSDSNLEIVDKTAYITNPIGVDFIYEWVDNTASVGSIPFLEQVKWLGSIKNKQIHQIEWNSKKGWIYGDVLSLEYPDKTHRYFNYLQDKQRGLGSQKGKPDAQAKALHESAMSEYKNKNISKAEDLWFQASLKAPL